MKARPLGSPLVGQKGVGLRALHYTLFVGERKDERARKRKRERKRARARARERERERRSKPRDRPTPRCPPVPGRSAQSTSPLFCSPVPHPVVDLGFSVECLWFVFSSSRLGAPGPPPVGDFGCRVQSQGSRMLCVGFHLLLGSPAPHPAPGVANRCEIRVLELRTWCIVSCFGCRVPGRRFTRGCKNN